MTLLLLLIASARAAPLLKEDVPPPLAPWIGWVLDGQEQALCPFLQERGERPCAWPGVLKLDLVETGGRFEQVWRVHARAWAALPGDHNRWPQEVRVGGVAAPVVQRDGGPAVELKPGSHAISGSFKWDSLPEQLRIPPQTGLLGLSVRGKPVPFPVRDEHGRVWLQKARGAERQESHLAVSVHRRLTDDVPLHLLTQIQLRVSGPNREVVLGKSLPAGFLPLSLTGPLPARVEPDGRLRAQVRAGTWTLELAARHDGPATSLTLPEPGGPWDSDEAWVFEARPQLRVVEISGAPAIDPEQTELPGPWRSLPAYLMKPGTQFKLVERRRGDQDPVPDRLTLRRELWLDFDGKGLTARDSLSGTLSRSWRLEMGPETRLGLVSIGEKDQFITSVKPGGPAGVEVREGNVSLSAESRVEARPRSLPAVSWSHDFDQVGATLRLPPGWRLIGTRGVDAASPTWVGTWTLLDLFMVLVVAAAVFQLWGPGWALAALAGTGLCWHEAEAPRWLWLIVVAAEALRRALAEHPTLGPRLMHLRRGAWILLVLVAVPFLISQARVAMYPQLELESEISTGALAGMEGEGAAAPAAAPQPEPPRAVRAMRGRADSKLRMADKGKSMISGAVGRLAESTEVELDSMVAQQAAEPRFEYELKQMLALDPKAQITTGPGLPRWSWHSVELSWKGPVDSEQRLKLCLVGPCGNFILALLRMALTVILVLLVGGLPVGEWLAALRGRDGWRSGWRWLFPALFLAVLPGKASPQTTSFPPKEMLDDLRSRLLRPPECAPRCAESPYLKLEVSPGSLRGRLLFQAQAPTAVPLPTGGKDWSPARVRLDASPAPVRRSEDGGLWVTIPTGSHEVVFEGPLPDRDSVQLNLPLKPRRIETSVAGWTLHGVREDGLAEDVLQLSRSRGPTPESMRSQASLPPFVRIERALRLGLSWEVETAVVRLTPTGSPIVLAVPLLPGESVTTAEMRVDKGKAQVNLAPQATHARWTSVLKEAAQLKLSAPRDVPWVELWRLEAGPIWNASVRGIPTVHREAPGMRTREWRPWPGEEVEISISRPAGIPGQTLTIERSTLSSKPGLRASDATLTLEFRSSRGGQHVVTLPEGADLRSVHMDGAAQPVRQEGRKVSLPVRPSSRQAELAWRESVSLGLLFRIPEIDAGAASVNSHIELHVPERRWVLLVAGPRLGPAVLFWSQAVVFLIVSIGLGRLGWSPLGWRHWLLLSLGLTQVSVASAAVVAAWFLAAGLRGKHPPAGRREFNAAQLFLVFLTLVAGVFLFRSIAHGLLGLPEMQIGGNGSSSDVLRWYQDRSGAVLPRPWVLSVPLGVYRLAMLAWALWLASSLVGWSRWGWSCFTNGGLWRSKGVTS